MDYLGIAAIITAFATLISSLKNGRTNRKIKQNVNSRMEELIHQIRTKEAEIERLKTALQRRYKRNELDD